MNIWPGLRAAWPRRAPPACVVVFPAPAQGVESAPLWNALRRAIEDLGPAVTGLPTTVRAVRRGQTAAAEPRRAYRLIANLAYLLRPDPPPHELLRRAGTGRIVVAEDPARGEIQAGCFRAPVPPEDLERLLALVGEGAPPMLRDRGRFNVCAAESSSGVSPAALSIALTEVAGAADLPGAGDPGWLVTGLLAARDRSRVPWVFNTLANELEYRLGVSCLGSLPPEVHLSLTSACNIECRFCSYTHRDARRDAVDLGQVQRLDFLRHLHTLRLSSGLGEPTLAPDLPACRALDTRDPAHFPLFEDLLQDWRPLLFASTRF